jgi:hypothetical protein
LAPGENKKPALPCRGLRFATEAIVEGVDDSFFKVVATRVSCDDFFATLV